MNKDADGAPYDSIAAFAGENIARAVTTLARGATLAPFGAARSADGGDNQLQQFVVNRARKIDLAESSEAALQWLEDEAARADICMIVIDGYINDEDDERSEAVVGRILSLKRQIMVDLALPYEPNEGEEGYSFAQPLFRFSGVAAEGSEAENISVDADAFGVAFRNAFMRYAPTA